MEYMSCPEAAKKWGISERRVQRLSEMPAYLAFQKSVICGLYQRQQISQ